MQFNQYFSVKDLKTIIKDKKKYLFAYHLTITFENKHNKESILNRIIIEKLPAEIKFYGWQCRTSGEKKKSNNHPRRIHNHAIIYSNEYISPEDLDLGINLDIRLKLIDSCVIDILKYIHDGHHEIKFNLYKKRYKNKKLKVVKPLVYNDLKELLGNLRTYGNNRLLYYGGPD